MVALARHPDLPHMVRCIGPDDCVQPGATVFHIVAHRTSTLRGQPWYAEWLREIMAVVPHA
jgi:hypothetical protein